MHHLVIGAGEIGSAVAQVFSDSVDILDVHPETFKKQPDVVHICFGYFSGFVKEVKRYQAKYQPKLTIIYSTVPIGTTKKIPHAVHSPVEGKHPRLYSSLMMGKRFIGHNDVKSGKLAEKVWESAQLVPNSDWTEFLKLASTAKYGINLVWADYMSNVSQELGMNYDLVKEWDQAYNQLYRRLKYHNYRKFILEPPSGQIGGHCIVPNAFLLDDQFPHEMLKLIKEYI